MRPAGRRTERKRRTRGHVIADLAENHVERHVLLCGHVVERVSREYGIDLKLLTFDARGRPENGEVYIQVKATDHVATLRRAGEITFPIERGDLEAWLGYDEPVILIVYDARRDVAHWLYVQAFFRKLARFPLEDAPAKITVRISTDNLLDVQAVRKFCAFRDQVLWQRQKVRHDEQ